LTITKPATIFKNQYFDSGKVDEHGTLELTVENPLVVTAETVKAQGVQQEAESFTLAQEKPKAAQAPNIEFQKLANTFIARGFKKYLFIITALKKKVAEEGKLAVDDGFYLWVNGRLKEKFKSDFNIVETDQLADLMIDFLEQQNWPMEILTARGDAAQKGGIDFNPEKMNTQVQNYGGAINFDFDPAMIQQLQNMPGFSPVIINIRPLNDLKMFLGSNDPAIGTTALSATSPAV